MTLSICVGSDAITYAAGAAQALAASDGSKKNTHDSTQSRTFGHNSIFFAWPPNCEN
jgi:hypothetical protein